MSKTTVFLGDYVLEKNKKLGQGQFGKVFRGYRINDNLPVAIKVIQTSKLAPHTRNNLDLEISTLRKMNHENIIKLYDVYERKKEICIITELCDGTLEDTIGNEELISKEQFISYLRDIVEALKYLNANKIVHRDLKPANILTSNSGRLKIADFGLVKHLEHNELAKTFAGSPLYMAPEVLNQKKYDSKVDLWSIGIIFYELLAGHRPYHASSLMELINIIAKKPLEYPNEIFSPSLKKLISGLLEVDPEKRFSINDVLNNDYVKKNCSSKLMETYCQEDLNNFESTYSIVVIEDALEIQPLKMILDNKNTIGGVNYPQIIFDFKNLKSNQEELIIIEAIEENLKRSWVIAELAFMKSKKNEYNEASCLYLKSIELLHTSYISIKGDYKSKRINAIKYWIKQRYDEFLDYERNIQYCIKEKKKKISCEKLIFDYTIFLMESASLDEYIENSSKEYRILYERSLILISYLNTLKIDQNDQLILRLCKICYF
eukprot:gene6468-10474_t